MLLRFMMLAIMMAFLSTQALSQDIEGCVLYKNKNFGGGDFLLVPDSQYGAFYPGLDNEVSSVRVGKLCTLYAYRDWLFQGLIGVYKEGDYPQLEENDAMTSAECFCEYLVR